MIVPTTRRGFTLVELLVSLALAIVVLGIAIAVSQTSLVESYKVNGTADKVSQALVAAKSRAIREKAPRGIRFLVDPKTNLCTELVTIEQPDSWTPSANPNPALRESMVFDAAFNHDTSAATYPPKPGAYGYKRVWVSNGTLGDFDYYPQANRPATLPPPKVRVGDRITVPALGMDFKIAQITVVGAGTRPDYPPSDGIVRTGVTPTAPTDDPAAPNATTGGDARAAFQLFLADPVASPGTDGTAGGPPNPPTGFMLAQTIGLPDFGAAVGVTVGGTRNPAYRAESTGFGVVRQPQPLVGEQTIQLSSGMVIDFNVSGTSEMLKRATANNTSAVPQPAPHPVPTPATTQPTTYFDILFGSSGEVIGTTSGQTMFVIRDWSKSRSQSDTAFITSTATGDAFLALTNPAEAELLGPQVLVVVYNRTGAVAAHRMNTDGGSPYKFALDAINTGL